MTDSKEQRTGAARQRRAASWDAKVDRIFARAAAIVAVDERSDDEIIGYDHLGTFSERLQ
jgi:hypothetical protein